METKYILVNNLNEQLVLNLWDYNDHRKNTKMASTSFSLSKLLEDSTQEDLVSPLLRDGKERGELRYDVNYYPVIEPPVDASVATDDDLMESSKLLSRRDHPPIDFERIATCTAGINATRPNSNAEERRTRDGCHKREHWRRILAETLEDH